MKRPTGRTPLELPFGWNRLVCRFRFGFGVVLVRLVAVGLGDGVALTNDRVRSRCGFRRTIGVVRLDEFAEVEKHHFVREPSGLVHAVCDHDDRVLRLQ